MRFNVSSRRRAISSSLSMGRSGMWNHLTSYRELISELQHVSDRTVAVIGSALVENYLTDAIKRRLRKHPNAVNQLLQPDGAVGSFRSKVCLGFLIRIYEESIFDDLNRVAKMRNDFAHKAEPLTFDAPKIALQCRALTIVDHQIVSLNSEKRFTGTGLVTETPAISPARSWLVVPDAKAVLDSPRLRFEAALQLLCFGLQDEIFPLRHDHPVRPA